MTKTDLSTPESQRFIPRITAISNAISSLVQEDETFDTQEGAKAVGLLAQCANIARTMGRIEDISKKTAFWSHSNKTKIWRLATYIETQAIFAHDKFEEIGKTNGILTNLDGVTATIPIEDGEGTATTSLDLAFESNVDFCELVLRINLHTNKGLPGQLEFISPYEDPDFELLLRTASAWRQYAGLWERIRFSRWLPSITPYGTLWSPEDIEDFIRSEIGNIRERLYLSQSTLSHEHVGQSRMLAHRRALDALTNSIKLPDSGNTWDLNVNAQALRAAMVLDVHTDANEAYMQRRFVGPILEHLSLRSGLSWRSRFQIMRALRALARSLQTVCRSTFNEDVVHGWHKTVVSTNKHNLCELVAAATGLSRGDCERGIGDMIFHEGRKRLEIWDQPLIPIDEQNILLVPTLITSAHPVRTIEHLISDVSGTAFDLRGAPYEEAVADRLAHETGSKTKRCMKFHASDGRQIEYDLVLWWEEHLFIFEMKCLKSITSPVDEHGAREEIDKAVNQLNRRVSVVFSDWPVIRRQAKDLALPESAPPTENVHAIVLTNIMQFTGKTEGPVVVTDDSCLFRYFGKSEVDLTLAGSERRERLSTLFQIRQNEQPSAIGL